VSKELPAIKPKDLVRTLHKAGFESWRQKGGHLTLYRGSDNRSLTVPVHFSRTVPKGTLSAIIKQAGLSVEEFNLLRGK
jgi:predicted RNA binding protein YcfA (HicA-like mRNA interferase family)